MAFAISRDARITALWNRLHARSEALHGLTPGSPSHVGIQQECDAIHAEIRRLENCIDISPKALLICIGLVLLGLYMIAH